MTIYIKLRLIIIDKRKKNEVKKLTRQKIELGISTHT